MQNRDIIMKDIDRLEYESSLAGPLRQRNLTERAAEAIVTIWRNFIGLQTTP